MKLAILVPTTPERKELRDRMGEALTAQIERLPVGDTAIILMNESERHENGGKSTGQKSNELMFMAEKIGADYIARFDDDDLPGPNYIERIFEGMRAGYDCCELWGQIYFNGVPGNPFHHYIDCVNPANGKIEWWQDNKFYYRMINHLNAVKLSLVKDIQYPDQVFGEDGKWSEAVRDAGVLKTMYPIDEIIYHYFTGEPKHKI